MSKKNQLNIRIDEGLIKTLKFMALEEDITLGDLVIDILKEKVSKGRKTSVKSFTDLHASNCTNFMRSLFKVKFNKGKYDNPQEAFNELISIIQTFSQWDKKYSIKLKEVLTSKSLISWSAEELNTLTRERNCECPIYLGLKSWTGCKEFPSQDLICDLGASLVPIISENI